MNNIILLISFIIFIILLLTNCFIERNKIKKLKIGDLYFDPYQQLNPFEDKIYIKIIDLKYNFRKKLYVQYYLIPEEKLNNNKINGFFPTKILSAKKFIKLFKIN